MNTYWFGQNIPANEWKADAQWKSLIHKKHKITCTELTTIISCLDGFAQTWTVDSENFRGAVPTLIEESGFSKEEVVQTLSLLKGLLSQESLEKRVRSEFTNWNVLDRFAKVPHFNGMVRAVPRGILLHVTAGNVFLSSIDSLIMGFLTKNLSVVKVSSQNKFFPNYFAQKLLEFDEQKILSDKFAILHWKGGETETEQFIKKKVDGIVAWGGEEMVESYRRDLPASVKFLDFGPKISLQLISKASLIGKDINKVADAIVKDIIPWDQGACASPQNLYLEEGLDEKDLIAAIDKAFSVAPPRGSISDDELVEIMKEKYRALYSELMEDGKVTEGIEHLIHMEKNKFLRPSPLGRSLIIKRFKDALDLIEHLAPFSYYLQSCSYLLTHSEKETYLHALSLAGIKRFAPLGTITWGMEGAPHDGRLVLRELVNFVGDEARIHDYGENNLSIQTSSRLKAHFESTKHPQGYIFSSGGTTGEPKYVHYSYEEFDRMTDMLAYNFRAQGIHPGTTVANLFVAGNLWSSFLAVEKSLEKIGAIQLPIGGLCPNENIVTYLNKFKPEVVLGIPSLLVMSAELGLNLGHQLSIKKVFYAGEAMSEARREFLRKTWNVEYFGSAGYASVDAGVIGYQCELCLAGEHHLFSDVVDMKIVDGEALVTSFSRHTLPIKNYATGDRVEWLPDCACGRKDQRFKLLGRIDNTIQIWSCRVLLGDIEKSVRNLNPEILSFQIILTEKQEEKAITENMEITYEVHEHEEFKADDLKKEIYQNSRDLKDTISFETFVSRIHIKSVGPGEIKRNSRTGKISVILDRRK